jgi:hypothetical protein
MGSAILNSIAPEEPKVVVPEYGETADIQDKEVSMEQLCSISTYDQWTPLSVSGQLPKPRYKVYFGCLDCLISLSSFSDLLSVMTAAWSCGDSAEDVCLWWKPQWPLPWRHSGKLFIKMLYLLIAAFMGRHSHNHLELRCCTEPAPSSYRQCHGS